MVLTDNMFKVGEKSCIQVKKTFKPKIVIFLIHTLQVRL